MIIVQFLKKYQNDKITFSLRLEKLWTKLDTY
jgi:hypothetical protein